MARKDNSNSIASRLSRIEVDAERTAFDVVRDWFALENMPYETAVERIEAEFNLNTSTAALVSFFQKHCVGFKMRNARALAAEVKKVLAESDESFDDASMALAEQRAFELAVENGGDVADLVSLQKLKIERIKLQLQREKIDQDNRRITLLEKKAAFVDEMKDKSENREGGLTSEDMEEIERKLKLL